MKKNHIAKSLAVAAQFMILMAAPGLGRTQSPSPRIAQPSALSQTQKDLYADAFARLTYTDKQTEAISKIRQDIASRKSAVLRDHKLTPEQKDAMLTGYARIEVGLIYKELTPGQKKQVSTRMRALSMSEPVAPNKPPAR